MTPEREAESLSYRIVLDEHAVKEKRAALERFDLSPMERSIITEHIHAMERAIAWKREKLERLRAERRRP